MQKAIIIGIDGFDPNITEKLMSQGKLPNFLKLKTIGFYSHLSTSNPAQSPVAWTSMATGVNPGKHGIFDFIARDPLTYLPYLSIVKQNKRNFFAKRSSMFLPVYEADPFWTITSRNSVPTSVIKWPLTFPPTEVTGRMLSGLGTPDLKNSLGSYTFYTTADTIRASDIKGDLIKLSPTGNYIKTVIVGPDKIQLPIRISVHGNASSLKLDINGKKYTFKIGEWSDWINITFHRKLGKPIVAMCKFLLKSMKPDINMYMTSLHIDPRNPSLQISYPDSYASDIASHIGPFHTLSLPEETNGLIDYFLSYDEILNYIDDLQKEREKIFWYELKQFRSGIFAFMFDEIDRIQHILGRAKDPKHPLYNNKEAQYFNQTIELYYRGMDRIVGKILKEIDSKTLFIIVSDHGLDTFRSMIHINTWLVDEGLMTLKEGSTVLPLFENVDWKKTKAYSLGFSSLYINLFGREKKGIIKPGDEYGKLIRKIRKALLMLDNPKTKEKIIHNAYFRAEVYSGRYVTDAPDIILGLKPGYRLSWQTAVGGGASQIVEDNLKPWSSDHIVGPSFVPGALFMNKKGLIKQPNLHDIAPTLLKFFDLASPHDMEGKAITIKKP